MLMPAQTCTFVGCFGLQLRESQIRDALVAGHKRTPRYRHLPLSQYQRLVACTVHAVTREGWALIRILDSSPYPMLHDEDVDAGYNTMTPVYRHLPLSQYEGLDIRT